MAASVRVEDLAFGDPRFEVLGALLGSNKYEALGRMIHLWRWCTEKDRHELPLKIAAVYFDGNLSKASAVVEAELADFANCTCSSQLNSSGVQLPSSECKHIRLRGTAGRVEWLAEKRAANREGGKIRAAQAERDSKGRLLPKNPATAGPAGSSAASGSPASPGTSSPAPSSAPALALVQDVLSLQERTKESSRQAGDGVDNCVQKERRKKPRFAVDGDLVTAASERLTAYFNQHFRRNTQPDTWRDVIARALSKGYTERQLKAVIWFGAETWSESDTMRTRVDLQTLFKFQSSGGSRTLPQYLDLANELWPQLHNGEPPPWPLKPDTREKTSESGVQSIFPSPVASLPILPLKNAAEAGRG